MLKLLAFLVAVTALAFGFAWVADRPGTLAVDWLGLRIETGILTAIVIFIATVVAIMVVWKIITLIFGAPKTLSSYFDSRRRDKGYLALSKGMVAIGSGDAAGARRAVREAEKYLSSEPMTLLLGAQAAQLSEDEKAAHEQFERMLDDPRTQLLGLRGLYLESMKRGDDDAARRFAEQASAIRPGLGWAATAVFEDQAMRREWAAARASLKRNAEARLVGKDKARRLRAVLLTAEALEREDAEPDAARPLAVEAAKLAPDLVPAAALASRLLVRANTIKKAARILESAWRRIPHPDLAEAYIRLRPGDGAQDRVNRARRLAQLVSHQKEGELALAGALIDAGEAEQARDVLKAFADSAPSERVCLMMAEIEEKLGGDTGLVRAWMARALRAPRDPAWVADGIVSAEWEPLSPVTGRLDAFEWRVPLDKVSGDGTQIGRPTGPTAHLAPPPLEDETFDEEIGDDGPEEEADDTPLLPPARTVDGVETIEAAAEETVGTTAGETMSPPVEEMAPSPEPVATPTAEQPAPQEDVTPPSSEPQDLPAEQQAGAQEAAPPPPGSDAADPEAEPWQPTRAPDDPGPMPDEGDSSQPRRFRLF